MRRWALILLAAAVAHGADPRVDRWIRSQLPPGARAVGPDVHNVTVDEQFVNVESAGLSMQSLGPLEVRPYDGGNGIRRFVYRIPRHPKPAARPVPTPLGVIGTFSNGVPIYNPGNLYSFNDQNLWHADAVRSYSGPTPPLLQALLDRRDRHSPLIGFALDGYPIYGPYGWDENKTVRPLRSSYRFRAASGARRHLPAGEDLTPAQEGPPVNAEFPNGTFLEDYEFVRDLGDLDQHNGRFAKTPEFPEGTYAYFLATHPDGRMAYPYLTGPTYYGEFPCDALAPDWKLVDSSSGLRLLSKSPAWKTGEPVFFALQSPHSVLERVHEKEMHVLVISEDLATFDHIHPEAVTWNFYSGTYKFPHAGTYWIFVDHTPPGQAQTISRFRVNVAGSTYRPTDLRESTLRDVTRDGVRATLTVNQPMEAGRDLSFRFALSDAQTGANINDLQPYLGAWGHVLFVRKAGDQVIHAHPKEENPAPQSPWVHSHALPGPSPAAIETISGFKAPGLYKVWLQVQRNGSVLTFPFVLSVAPQRQPFTLSAVPNAQVISVSATGYSPARIVVPEGKFIRLAFQRLDAQNCGGRVVFPELGIDRELPPGKTVLIEIAPQAAKEFKFSCGMGMYRGALVVR